MWKPQRHEDAVPSSFSGLKNNQLTWECGKNTFTTAAGLLISNFNSKSCLHLRGPYNKIVFIFYPLSRTVVLKDSTGNSSAVVLVLIENELSH